MSHSSCGSDFLRVENLCCAYSPDRSTLTRVSFSLPCSARLALLGANGCGKSSLLLALNGTLPARAGHVTLAGETLQYNRASLRSWRQRVGLVLADPDHMILGATVEADLSFGPLNLGLPQTEVQRLVEEALLIFGLGPWRSHPVSTLSDGIRKRLALAGMAILRPHVLLLDEPANALDAPGQAGLRSMLQHLSGNGTTLIVATHDTDFAWEWATHWLVLESGSVRFFGSPAEAMPYLDSISGIALPRVVQWGRKLREHGLLDSGLAFPASAEDLDSFLAQVLSALPPGIQ